MQTVRDNQTSQVIEEVDNRREIHIEITAPHTTQQMMVCCDHPDCQEHFLVTEDKYEKLKGCPFCQKEGTLYATYSYIGVPTMAECHEEFKVTMTINQSEL